MDSRLQKKKKRIRQYKMNRISNKKISVSVFFDASVFSQRCWESSSTQLFSDRFNDILLHLAYFLAEEFLNFLFECFDFRRAFSRRVAARSSRSGFFAGRGVPFRCCWWIVFLDCGRLPLRTWCPGRWRIAGWSFFLLFPRCRCFATGQSFGHFIHHRHSTSSASSTAASTGALWLASTAYAATIIWWRWALFQFGACQGVGEWSATATPSTTASRRRWWWWRWSSSRWRRWWRGSSSTGGWWWWWWRRSSSAGWRRWWGLSSAGWWRWRGFSSSGWCWWRRWSFSSARWWRWWCFSSAGWRRCSACWWRWWCFSSAGWRRCSACWWRWWCFSTSGWRRWCSAS